MMIKNTLELNKKAGEWKQEYGKVKNRILVCAGTGCVASGSMEIYEKFKELADDKGIDMDIQLKISPSGCHGFCEMGPLVRIEPEEIFYMQVKLEDAEEIVEETILKGNLVERLLYTDRNTKNKYKTEDDIPFYKKQQRNVLGKCGLINPEDIKEYISTGGYKGFSKTIEDYTPEQVCEIISKSNLRGRGGGGFSTGFKWDSVRKENADIKYVVCNGDEGDPGAFMDRSIMEGDPHKILEGMLISGYATGASQGYIYVRAEYPLAIERLQKAIKDAECYGILGDNILGSGFNFRVKINKGAGAFVCGEGSALTASIEGQRGMPRTRPPRTVQKGLWNKPTVLNNVETFANVPQIMLNGVEWFLNMGTENNSGTKAFALTGNINNTGLIEVPMGITLREIIYEIGGGLPEGKELKAVQIGGPSGGCLTQEQLDLPLDFDSLEKVGAMIGSGGLVVMDDETCMVEVARFFMDFTQKESCGKCVPCREGTKRMLELLDKIVSGEGTEEDISLLKEVGEGVKIGSLCGLGKTASNPILTTLKYFEKEYFDHVSKENPRCPSGQCEAFKSYWIDENTCVGCSKCKKACPVGAISGVVKKPFTIDKNKCINCGSCVELCPFEAIKEG